MLKKSFSFLLIFETFKTELFAFIFLLMLSIFSSSKPEKNLYTIAFYNLENLFDTLNDPNTLDDDFTPKGKLHWNTKRYKRKIRKMSRVIAQLGTEKSEHAPALVGIVEVENATVLKDLIHAKALETYNYNFVHHESPDERGIDVALLYKKELFQLISHKTYPLLLIDSEGKRDYTRDVLHVTGKLNGELTHIIVNHWPSRRNGTETVAKRIKAAQLVRSIALEILAQDADAKIIIMGDFNDGPESESIQYLVQNTFYNAMARLLAIGKGTTAYKNKWNLFDQIIFTKNYLKPSSNKHVFRYAEVFDKDFLKVYKGKLKGSPFRTYISRWYQGGFSDHFPVYIYLKKKD